MLMNNSSDTAFVNHIEYILLIYKIIMGDWRIYIFCRNGDAEVCLKGLRVSVPLWLIWRYAID